MSDGIAQCVVTRRCTPAAPAAACHNTVLILLFLPLQHYTFPPLATDLSDLSHRT